MAAAFTRVWFGEVEMMVISCLPQLLGNCPRMAQNREVIDVKTMCRAR